MNQLWLEPQNNGPIENRKFLIGPPIFRHVSPSAKFLNVQPRKLPQIEKAKLPGNRGALTDRESISSHKLSTSASRCSGIQSKKSSDVKKFLSPQPRSRIKDPNPHKRDIPGPGSYNLRNSSKIYNSSPSFSLISRKIAPNPKRNIPGPGEYKILSKVVSNIRSSPKYGFGTSRKALNSSRTSETPSPGAYSVRSSFSNANSGVSMLSRRDDYSIVKSKYTPGPGAYNIKDVTQKKMPSWKMGSSRRESIQSISSRSSSYSPGPASYDPTPRQKNNITSIGMGYGKRSQIIRKSQDVPGPGSYYIPPVIGNEGKKFSLKGRIRQTPSSKEDVPGPGAYDSKIRPLNLPSFSLLGGGRRSHRMFEDWNPGPGQYNPTVAKKGGPKFSFTPGPGAYDPTKNQNFKLPKHIINKIYV